MKRIVVSGAVLALGIAGVQAATAAPAVYKVTGGGQIIEVGETGAGDTIAFSAQSQGEEGEAAKGQFQYIDRTGGTGQGQEVVHGTVSCVVVHTANTGDSGGYAIIGGQSRLGEDFRIEVFDDGQGAGSADMIMVRRDADARDGGDEGEDDNLCDIEEEDDGVALGRGNVKIHKEKAAAGGASSSQGKRNG
ncbi:MAG TPA: hypothetical protein VNU26_00865 [Mycobacteriales bacterium]|nr:hypothetical protein [Mycobacteriales bacterium]